MYLRQSTNATQTIVASVLVTLKGNRLTGVQAHLYGHVGIGLPSLFAVCIQWC